MMPLGNKASKIGFFKPAEKLQHTNLVAGFEVASEMVVWKELEGLATNRADLLIIASPLFADSLPYPVIRALELVATHRLAHSESKQQRLLAIVNSGFPEARHNDTAIAITASLRDRLALCGPAA